MEHMIILLLNRLKAVCAVSMHGMDTIALFFKRQLGLIKC